MKKYLVLFGFTLLLTFIVSQPAYCGTVYSLFDLSKLAQEHSENIKIAEQDVVVAREDRRRALAVLVPAATAYGSMTEYKDEDALLPDTTTWGIMFSQSFTINGKELIAYGIAGRTIEGKELALETVRSQYLLQVSEAYFNILSAQGYAEIAASDVKRLEAHREAVKEKLSVGNVTKTDLYRAEAEFSKSKTEQVVADNRVLKAKAALLNLVAIAPDFELEKSDIPSIANYQCTLEGIKAAALVKRPEILEAKKNIEIARKNITFEWSDYFPTLAIEGGYKETEIRYDASPVDVKYDNEDYYITGTLTFTFFDGGLRGAEVRQAKAKLKQAQNALTLQEKSIILASHTAYLDYTAARTTMINLNDELKSSQENFNAVQMQFKYGMADSIDMMDANTLLVSAQRRLLDAKYNFYLAVLKILHTKGEIGTFLAEGK